MFPVVLFFAFVVFAIGVFITWKHGDYTVLASGCLAVFAVLAVWCLALNVQAPRQSDFARAEELLAPVNERMQQINVLLNLVSEQQLISERAKAIAFRDQERDTFRRAIREEIAKKDYEAALALVGDIESVFGYRQEADRFREEINALRQQEVTKVVNEAAVVIDRHCRAEQWNLAIREAERLMSIYPGDPSVQRLPQEIEGRRQAHKKQLQDSWEDAVNRHDVDGSIEILKQLDAYLTPAEAEAMQETARRVFKDKLQLLGQQFALAVKDHLWADSVRLGEAVMREFPNSRMAQEVREKIDLLRERAASPQGAAAV